MAIRIIFIMQLFLLCALQKEALSNDSAQHARTSTLTVFIQGCKNNTGNIKIALTNSKASFEQDSGIFRVGIVNADTGVEKYAFDSIPYGLYAVKAFHDDNNNGVLDKFLGLPRERVGASKIKKLTGPPTFEKAKFFIDTPKTKIKITLE